MSLVSEKSDLYLKPRLKNYDVYKQDLMQSLTYVGVHRERHLILKFILGEIYAR
jgi:hypothetical protein